MARPNLHTTSDTDIAWGFHIQGIRGRGPAGSVALRVYSQRLYNPRLGNDSGSHPGREKGDRSPCGAGHGATELVWTVPEATADPRVVSAWTELQPLRARWSNFQRKFLHQLKWEPPPPVLLATEVPKSAEPPRGLQTSDYSPIYPATNFKGPDPSSPPVDLGSLIQPSPYARAPASHRSVLLAGAREHLQSVCDASLKVRAGANSPHAGPCPRSRGERFGAPLTPLVDSAELAPHDAKLSLLRRRANGR